MRRCCRLELLDGAFVWLASKVTTKSSATASSRHYRMKPENLPIMSCSKPQRSGVTVDPSIGNQDCSQDMKKVRFKKEIIVLKSSSNQLNGWRTNNSHKIKLSAAGLAFNTQLRASLITAWKKVLTCVPPNVHPLLLKMFHNQDIAQPQEV